jgi:ubiquinone/menaquinone biosynthesis C-methylase UbiE
MIKNKLKRRVQAFWNKTPCGTREIESDVGSQVAFDQLESERDDRENFIKDFAQFSNHEGKKVLEVGIGAGSDFIRFARGGATLHGIDLTINSIHLVRKRLALENKSAFISQGDAENLPYPNDYFDFVYSWGVVHHTDDTQKAINEIIRVTKDNGTICVMIYHRHSLVGLQCWIINALLKGKPWLSLSEVVYENIESIGTKAFSISEAKSMFSDLSNLKISPIVTPYDVRLTRSKFLPSWVQSMIPNRLGWFLAIQGKKISNNETNFAKSKNR